MVAIPKDDNLHHQINSVVTIEKPRAYLGISQIGDSCLRKLQYYHYWAYTIPLSKRMQRLFNFGKIMENYMIQDLASLGIIVVPDPEPIIGITGHWKGHTDGDGSTDEKGFLVEFKTHNDKSFKDLKKNKVKRSKPGHYDQMQGYMDGKGYNEALYVAYNKNDSEYYLEWVPRDEERIKELKAKQIEVIASDVLLPRIGNNSPSWFECKMCEASRLCFGKAEPEKNCRTCLYVDVLNDGEWSCNNPESGHSGENSTLPAMVQRQGCPLYKLGEMFL